MKAEKRELKSKMLVQSAQNTLEDRLINAKVLRNVDKRIRI